MSWPSPHQQQLRDLFEREGEPTTPSRRSSEAYGSADITLDGIVSQYDVVCICCSGRSSSPDPTFSFV